MITVILKNLKIKEKIFKLIILYKNNPNLEN